MTSLLERALSIPVKTPSDNEPTQDEIDLAMAYAEGKVIGRQCMEVLEVSSTTGVGAILFRALCSAIRSGYLVRSK